MASVLSDVGGISLLVALFGGMAALYWKFVR
jgi:hypothetical protein